MSHAINSTHVNANQCFHIYDLIIGFVFCDRTKNEPQQNYFYFNESTFTFVAQHEKCFAWINGSKIKLAPKINRLKTNRTKDRKTKWTKWNSIILMWFSWLLKFCVVLFSNILSLQPQHTQTHKDNGTGTQSIEHFVYAQENELVL